MNFHATEVEKGDRFEFGRNWQRFLERLDDNRIAVAEESLRVMLGVSRLDGRSFLDIGSGSGLFSLAARRLGARVMSVDYDPYSVDCTRYLKDRYFPGDEAWVVAAASVLDADFLARAGKFDIVYSWGVLHHTGNMSLALGNAASLVANGGRLFISIYNDQGRSSRYWLKVKRVYNAMPKFLRWAIVLPCFVRLWGPTTLRDLFRGTPFRTWRARRDGGLRGMDPWRDVQDWVGGLPFEVAKPEEIFYFYRDRHFVLQELKTCAGGIGCNEYVFLHAGPTTIASVTDGDDGHH